MQILTKTQNLFTFLKENADKFLNHLFILYIFFLPITGPASTVFFAILILFVIRGNLKQHILKSLKNKVILSFFLLFCVSILWILGTDDFTQISIEIKRMKIFLFPIIFYSFLQPKFIPKAILAFMTGMLISEITSYAIFLQIIDPIFYKGYLTPDPSPFFHHSHYGLLLALTSGILLYRLIAYKDNLTIRLLSLTFFITVTINIFITGGRMGYILYIVAILTILTMHKIKLLKTLVLTFLLAGMVFSLAYQFSPLFQKRLEHTMHGLKQLNTQHPFNSSFGTRLGFMYYSIPVIQEHLVFGVGTGDHVDTVHNEIKKQNKDIFLLDVTHFHNAHLTIFVQFGLLGLFIWLNIFYQSFIYKQENHFMQSVLILIVVLLFFYSFLAAFFKVQIAAIFTALITILITKTNAEDFKHMKFSKNELLFYLFSLPMFFILKAVS